MNFTIKRWSRRNATAVKRGHHTSTPRAGVSPHILNTRPPSCPMPQTPATPYLQPELFYSTQTPVPSLKYNLHTYNSHVASLQYVPASPCIPSIPISSRSSSYVHSHVPLHLLFSALNLQQRISPSNVLTSAGRSAAAKVRVRVRAACGARNAMGDELNSQARSHGEAPSGSTKFRIYRFQYITRPDVSLTQYKTKSYNI